MARSNRGNSRNKNKLRIAKPHYDEGDLENSKEVSFRDTVDMFKSIGNQPSRKLMKEGKHRSYKEMMEAIEGRQKPVKQAISSKNLAKLIEYLADRNSEESSKSEEGGLITVKSKAKLKVEFGEENAEFVEYVRSELESGKIDPEELKEVANILRISGEPLECNGNYETKKKNWRSREEYGAQVEQRFMTDKQLTGEDYDAIAEQEEDGPDGKKRDLLGYLSHKAIRNGSPTKQGLEISMTEPNTLPPRKEATLQLSITAFERLAQLHHRKGTCKSTAPGELC